MVGDFFNTFLINPLTNLFVLLAALTGSAGVAIIVITVLIRFVTLPLYMKQMHQVRTFAVIAPRMQEIQKRYKDPRRRSQEQMKLYREAGVNPLGCFSSMLMQFPILISLYATIRLSLGSSPEALIELSHRLYPLDYLRSSLPLGDSFLWLELGSPDPFVMPVFVAITTYVMQKMTSLPPTDEKQAAQTQMMNLMMPLIFGWITLTLPSGLGLYYALSNLIGMAMQYVYVGGGPINWRALLGMSKEPVLPRSVEMRKAQMENFGRLGQDEEQQSDDAEETPARRAASARRRRRYASGRRRGRR